ncbi:MAG TPA: tripartite tricarboxylate transporter TctB family protein [Alphaproteobacteria bacterium]|nr:tripartite tricarboxylate transporter TctB family protein [Alphaproteobacteria bacterium]
MTSRLRDLLAGAVFVALGLAFLVGALGLERGTAFRMGPGYFPLVLAGLLVLIGAAIAIRALREQETVIHMHAVPWRGLVLILAAPVLFGFTVRGLGLLPAIAMVALISSFASRRMKPLLAGAITVLLTLFCVLVFNVGLGLPIRLIGPWLS